jgi:hypothetical protein
MGITFSTQHWRSPVLSGILVKMSIENGGLLLLRAI